MTRDDIVAMAQEAIITHSNDNPLDFRLTTVEQLEYFAAIVEARKEQVMVNAGWRQCAKGQRTTQFCGQLEAAVQAEREACAKLCDDLAEKDKLSNYYKVAAVAIRKRGQA